MYYYYHVSDVNAHMYQKVCLNTYTEKDGEGVVDIAMLTTQQFISLEFMKVHEHADKLCV